MIAILLPLLAATTGNLDDPVDCENAMTQQDMNICAHRDYLAADELLNQQWDRTAAAMRERDAQWGDSFDERPGYFEVLLESQRAWLQYRDAQCAVEGYWARGGSLEPLLVSGCLTLLTRRRTEELREIADYPD